MPPMKTDQNSAGFSRAAQRQYRKGVDQKWGAAPDIVLQYVSEPILVVSKGAPGGSVRNSYFDTGSLG